MYKELDYTLERKDFFKFLCFHQYKNKFILVLELFLFIFFSYNLTKGVTLIQGIFLIIVLTSTILYFFSPYISSLKHEKIKLNIQLDSEKKSFIVNDLTKVEFNWNHIKSVCNSKHNLLIYITNKSAFIIPKRIFNDEQEMNETWNLIQECYNKNKI